MSRRVLSALEISFIILLACVPLFATFPYRVNIFLSWEGAYRISEGQLPFRDFGTPLGGMFWVIPGLFFKIFGPQLLSLVKAQVFINIVSGLAFRSILKSLSVNAGIRMVSIVLFVLSYSFMNFWPWYNHSVIVYELVALAFLFHSTMVNTGSKTWAGLGLSALFVVCSFFTKQDGGGMAFAICLALLVYNAILEKNWKPLFIFLGSFAIIMTAVIVWLSSYGFGYWFNHGQPPHTARISVSEIANDFFYGSQGIKIYLFLIAILLLAVFRSWQALFLEKKEGMFFLLTLAILVEAAVFQVTSYTPPDNNIFYHSFAIAYILYLISRISALNFMSRPTLLVTFAGIMLWWSGTYWKYIQRVLDRALPPVAVANVSKTGENVVNRNTYMINKVDPLEVPVESWVYSDLKAFRGIYMPQSTVDGMNRLLKMDLAKNNPDIKVLNMSELTPLAVEMPYKLETSKDYPLWFHLGVGMFNREAEMFEKRIAAKHYDLVLFEHIETLNNFYPFRTRTALQQHYKLVDSFIAPRRGYTNGYIEVYTR